MLKLLLPLFALVTLVADGRNIVAEEVVKIDLLLPLCIHGSSNMNDKQSYTLIQSLF